MHGLIGRKLGMTQVFDESGRWIGVTVLQVGPCDVIQRKTREKDGYDAVQVAAFEQKPHRVPRPILGHCAKAGVGPRRVFREFALDSGEDPKPGDRVTVAMLEGTDYVDVTGISKGRGFQGVVKRHGMRGGPMSHGSHSKRRVGSVGQKADPGNIARGQRMPGHLGARRVTQKNLRVVQIRLEDHLLLVEGAVPGASGSVVEIRKSARRARRAESAPPRLQASRPASGKAKEGKSKA